MPKLLRLDTSEKLVITTTGIVFGRERGCDVMLRSKSVSRQHARIILQKNVPFVEDLGSSNGTRVNGALILGVAELHVGDLVAIGDSTFRLVEDALAETDAIEAFGPQASSTAEIPIALSPKLPKKKVGGFIPGRRKLGKESVLEPKPAAKVFESIAPNSAKFHRNTDNRLHESSKRDESDEKPVDAADNHVKEEHVAAVESADNKPSRKQAEFKVKSESTFEALREKKRSPPQIRQRCIATFVFMMILSFALGRVTFVLGWFEMTGERAARANVISQMESQAQLTLAVRGHQSDGEVTSVDPPQNLVVSSIEVTQSNQNPYFATGSNDMSTMEQQTDSADDERDEGEQSDSARISNDADSSRGMSMTDSAKSLKLMREATRFGVDMGDTDALMKIALEQMELSNDQAVRVVRFVKLMGVRKAIMDGGIDSVFNLKQQPANTIELPQIPEGFSKQDRSKNKSPMASNSSGNPSRPQPPKGAKIVEAPVRNLSPSQNQQVSSRQESRKTRSKSTQRKHTTVETRVRMPLNRGPGYFLNVWGIVMFFCLLLAWLNSVQWMGDDIAKLEFEDPIWLRISFIAGPAGAIGGLCCPDLGCGMMLNSVCLGGPLLGYLAARDKIAPRGSRLPWLLQWFESEATNACAADQNGHKKRIPLEVEFLDNEESGIKSHDALSTRFFTVTGVRSAKKLLANAYRSRASEIHLELDRQETLTRFRIDGEMRRDSSCSVKKGRAIITVFKMIASMKITERRGSQDGRGLAKIGEDVITIRVAWQAETHGEKLTVKLLRDQEELTNLAGIGCNRRVQGEIRSLIARRHGLLLVCGPNGAGKSTTLRAMLTELDSSKTNITTVERPVEYQIPGATQIEVDSKSEQTFATVLQGVLRHEPEVVMVGEICDSETATIACQAANTGHMVLSSLQANSTLMAIQRLFELGVEPSLLADVVSGILGQRLVRRLCSECKVTYHPDTEFLRRHRIAADRKIEFSRPPENGSRCEACDGIGFRGLVGIFELLKITDEIRKLVRGRASSSLIKSTARRDGMTTLREEGFRLSIRGGTSLKEVLSVTND